MILKKFIGKVYYFLLTKYENRNKNLYFPFSSQAFKTTFGRYVKINNNVTLNNCIISDFSYIGSNSKLLNCKVGKFCSIASNVKIGLGRHPSSDFISTSPVFYSQKGQLPISFPSTNSFEEYLPIEIGNDVWIGYQVVILDGVKVGNGAIIATGSVVTQNIPDYAIVGGIPAKVIKYRFSPKEIAFLLSLKWWEKNIEWIKENINKFDNIKEMMDKYQ